MYVCMLALALPFRDCLVGRFLVDEQWRVISGVSMYEYVVVGRFKAGWGRGLVQPGVCRLI